MREGLCNYCDNAIVRMSLHYGGKGPLYPLPPPPDTHIATILVVLPAVEGQSLCTVFLSGVSGETPGQVR